MQKLYIVLFIISIMFNIFILFDLISFVNFSNFVDSQLFSTIATISSVIALFIVTKIQYTQQEEKFKKEQNQQQTALQLSHIERQMSNIVNFILKNYIEKKEFYPKFENYIINKMGWNKNDYNIKENHNVLFYTNEKTGEERIVEKSNIMTLLYSYSINKILSLDELKEYIEKSTFKSQVKTFVYQLNYLIIMIEKSLDLGLDRVSAKYNLALFSMPADIVYDLGYFEENFYFKLKVLTDDFDYLEKIFLSELKADYKINESNIKDIVSYKNELNQYTFELYLHGFDFNLIRDEKAIWNKNKKNENEICYNN